MINNQNSRRKFLGSIAILTVGSAFGPATQFLADSKSTTDLKTQWKRFCDEQGGRTAFVQTKTDTPQPVAGHRHEDGALVVFPKQDLLARPTWVYWSEKKVQPSDLIITFYQDESSFRKLFRMNRYEWEAFLSLPLENGKQDLIALMREAATTRTAAMRKKQHSYLKVVANREGVLNITGRLSNESITINKQFSYSV